MTVVIDYWGCCLDTGTSCYWLLGLLSGYRDRLLLFIIGDALWIWGLTVVIDSWGYCLSWRTGSFTFDSEFLGNQNKRNRKRAHFSLDRRWCPHQAFSLYWGFGDKADWSSLPSICPLSPCGVTSVKESIAQATPLLGPTLTRHPTALVVTLRRCTSTLFF